MFQSIVWNVIESTRDCLKANNDKYFNTDTPREHNAPLFLIIKWNWGRLRKPTSHEFEGFAWSKINFGEIHQGLPGGFPLCPLSSIVDTNSMQPRLPPSLKLVIAKSFVAHIHMVRNDFNHVRRFLIFYPQETKSREM